MYFSIVLLTVYIAFEETYAVPNIDYEACVDSISTLFDLEANFKNMEQLYNFAFFNLTAEYPTDNYGKLYYEYLYLQVHHEENVSSPAGFCEQFYKQDKRNCIITLRASGFYHAIGQAAFRFAYRTPKKNEYKYNKEGYAYIYFDYLYNKSTLLANTLDPKQWCFDVEYLNVKNREIQTCINSLKLSFDFSRDVKNVHQCYEYAFLNMTSENPTDIYGQYYYGYLYYQVENKRSLFGPARFCDQFPGDTLNCKRTLKAAGFDQANGHQAIRFAYTTSRKHEFQLNIAGYPFKYFEHLFNLSVLPNNTQDINEWCAAERYNEDFEIRFKDEETALQPPKKKART